MPIGIGITESTNQCKFCSRRPGKYIHKETKVPMGVFLYNAHDGGKICNLCVMGRRGMPKRKQTKKERKLIQKMMRDSKETLSKLKSIS